MPLLMPRQISLTRIFYHKYNNLEKIGGSIIYN